MSNTISEYLEELVSQKSALAANLTTMGVSASSSEKLNTLVPKVLEIEGDEPVIQSLSVTQNGTYTPPSGIDGYAPVTVQVSEPVESIVGTDVDGNDYLVTVDETGHFVYTKLISSIQITALPNKTEYSDGETIDLTGLVVTGYYGDGTAANSIPLSEISSSETVADSSKMIKSVQEPLSVTTILPDCIQYAKKGETVYVEAGSGWKIDTTPASENTYLLILSYREDGKTVPHSSYISTCRIAAGKTADDAKGGGVDSVSSPMSYTYQNKTVYAGASRYSHNGPAKSCYGFAQGSYTPYSLDNDNLKKIAWSMVYAEGKQAIELTWLRYGDAKELICTFDITEAE